MYKGIELGPIELDMHLDKHSFSLGEQFTIDCMGVSLHVSLGFLGLGIAYWRPYDDTQH